MATTYLEHKPFFQRISPLIATYLPGMLVMLILTLIAYITTVQVNEGWQYLSIVLFILPFVIFCGPAGVLADTLPKRGVIILCKIYEFFFTILVSIALTHTWGTVVLPFVPAFAGLELTFLFPAIRGILPETFRERNLTRANADLSLAAFIAGALSVYIAPNFSYFMVCFSTFLSHVFGTEILISPNLIAGLILSLVSFISLTQSFRIFPTAVNPRNPTYENRSVVRVFVDGAISLGQKKEVLLSALADAFFLSLSAVVQLIVISNIAQSYAEMMTLQICSISGMALGGVFCGWNSRRKVEMGLVPFGALFLAIFSALAAFFPGMYSESMNCCPLMAVWLFLGGISAGYFVLPLRAYVQRTVKPEAIGSALAVSNAFCSLILLLIAFGSGYLVYEQIVSPEVLLAWIGIGALVVTAITGLMLPELLIRSAAYLLTHTLYRLRVNGVENIPQRSSALLVANHVTFADTLLIMACTSRKIRFLMHEKYYRNWFIHPFAKMIGSIEVPANGHHRMEEMFEEVRKGLIKGDLICVYPEGRISPNGLIGSFKAGFSKMLPEGTDIPLIPIHVGLVWGSMFSYYYGKRIRPHLKFSYPASISFGKPLNLTEVDTAFRLRQSIEELSAEAGMAPLETEKTLHYQLAKMAKKHPFRKVLCEYKGKRLSLFQTLVGAVVLSREIRKIAGDSKYVGVMLPNTTTLSVTLLAVMMADKTPSPLNYTASKEALRYSIDKAGMKLIITNGKFLDKLNIERIPEMVMIEDIAKGISKLDKFWWFLMCLILPHQELMTYVSPETHHDVFSTAVLLFSSGSTGRPKGVMLTHHNLNADILSIIKVIAWGANDAVLGSLPLFHSFGFSTTFWMPIYTASRVAYVLSPLDATAVGGAIESEKVTLMLATPTFVQAYMRKCRPEQFASVRLAIVGAEKLRKDIAAKFMEITNGKTALLEGYGATELSPIVSVNFSRDFEDLGKAPGKEGSIGVAMPGISVKIVDPVTREQLPPDTDGLMLVKGATVMKGYLEDPVQTANVISNGWYETGDIAHMDSDGYISISGRISRFSKIAGEMVPHELIECVMSEIIGKEERVVAVGSIPDKAKGEALVVLYIPEKMGITPDEMTVRLREHNIPNLWIPRSANYVAVESFPTIGTGKLDLMAFQKIVKKTFQV